MRTFSSALHRRRRRTDVTTSTRPRVPVVGSGISPHFSKCEGLSGKSGGCITRTHESFGEFTSATPFLASIMAECIVEQAVNVDGGNALDRREGPVGSTLGVWSSFMGEGPRSRDGTA